MGSSRGGYSSRLVRLERSHITSASMGRGLADSDATVILTVGPSVKMLTEEGERGFKISKILLT